MNAVATDSRRKVIRNRPSEEINELVGQTVRREKIEDMKRKAEYRTEWRKSERFKVS